MSVRFLHLSDIHLGVSHNFLPVDRQEIRSHEIYKSFMTVLEQVRTQKLKVDAVLISGDLFDAPDPDIHLLEGVRAKFRELAGNGISIILIPGNHDNIISPQSVYRREKWPDVHLLLSPNIAEPFEIELKGMIFHLYGMAYSFLSVPPFDEFRPQNPGVKNIALIHGSLSGNGEWQLHSQDVPLRIEKLYDTGFHYIALGHYHNFKYFQNNGTHIVYPGTLEPLGWGEEANRQIVIAEFEGERVSVIQQDWVKQYRFFRTAELDFNHHAIDSPDDAANYIVGKYENDQLFLRLILTGQTDFLIDAARLTEMCRDRFFYLRIEDQTAYAALETLEAMQGESTIRGLAVRKLISRLEEKTTDAEKKPVKDALRILMGYFTID